MSHEERDALAKLRTALDHLRAAERACEEVGYSRMNVLDPLANLRLDLTVVIATVADGDGVPPSHGGEQ